MARSQENFCSAIIRNALSCCSLFRTLFFSAVTFSVTRLSADPLLTKAA